MKPNQEVEGSQGQEGGRAPAPAGSSLAKGVRSVLSGRISFGKATFEAFRRGRAVVRSRRERSMLDELASQPARLRSEWSGQTSSGLLKHFREREQPSFFLGFKAQAFHAARQRELFPKETERLIESAMMIVEHHRWPLLGFGEKEFGRLINWHRDPLSGRIWPLDYHADIPLWHNDGSDIRVLWELNRLGHLITLGRAYALTNDEAYAAEFFAQVESWHKQNPVARGANWSCAMEVALRAMNLLAAFSLFINSSQLSAERLVMLLTMFDQHGAYIRRNLEFSHVATSNHYLSDVVGLLWLGILLPELEAAPEWRDWALAEMLRELDKQILPDGADYESSTGYHCFVLELFLYSLYLCDLNEIQIAPAYRRKLHAMLVYLRDILRPDGFVPLVGDTDGGQVLPIVARAANDRAYLLDLGAVLFRDSQFKLPGSALSQELLWLFGEYGLQVYRQLPTSAANASSQGFSDAGIYVMRHDDLFLLFNAGGAKKDRPASHRHNDALSIEVSACGRAFIVDPGTFLYTADLHERHMFRSTAYHSTMQIDDAEQNSVREEAPFAIGDEARAKVLSWVSTPERDRIVAEQSGYERLAEPARHRRTITFHKNDHWWLIEDEILGRGEHEVTARFHFDSGLDLNHFEDGSVMACDLNDGARLLLRSLDLNEPAELETQFTSRHYGSKSESLSASWTTRSSVPCKLRWAIIPVRADEDIEERSTVL